MSAGLWSLDPRFRPYAKALIDAVAQLGLNPQITSTRRSVSTQEKLYRDFLSGKSPYPAAQPGHSTHQAGLAFDMVLDDMSALRAVGEVWEGFGKGFRWGGRFNDPVHFDYKL